LHLARRLDLQAVDRNLGRLGHIPITSNLNLELDRLPDRSFRAGENSRNGRLFRARRTRQNRECEARDGRVSEQTSLRH
jgi:hypothetical protein